MRFEEVPVNNEEEFQSKIILGKRWNSFDEPKILNYSVETLIEKFCDHHAYLRGQASEYAILGKDGRVMDRGLVLQNALIGPSVHELRLVKKSAKLRAGSIASASGLVAVYNPQE